MAYKILYGIIILILTNSCTPLIIQEIGELRKTEFNDLELYPDVEPNELRIDIIRNSYSTYINGILYSEDIPYHPLGFNLGNGLFYDLNGNLGLRIEYFLGIVSGRPFEIEENINPKNLNRNILYSYINDSLVATNLFNNTEKYKYHKIGQDDSVIYKTKKFKYAVVKTDSTHEYIFRNRKPVIIYQFSKNHFSTGKNWNQRIYYLIENQIILGKAYSVFITNDSKTIKIYTQRQKQKSRPLFTIVKSEGKLIIYNSKKVGKKIEFNDWGITVLGPQSLITTYKLKNTPGENKMGM